MSFDKMIQEFKDFGDLKDFAESQYKTIISLSKKNSKMEEEIKHLKNLLETTVPHSLENVSNIQIDPSTSDEEIICRAQLKILKEGSAVRELTLDEARRVDIFAKILISLKNKDPKKDDKKIDNMKTADLLSLVEKLDETK